MRHQLLVSLISLSQTNAGGYDLTAPGAMIEKSPARHVVTTIVDWPEKNCSAPQTFQPYVSGSARFDGRDFDTVCLRLVDELHSAVFRIFEQPLDHL
jgi:hypothetical protein